MFKSKTMAKIENENEFEVMNLLFSQMKITYQFQKYLSDKKLFLDNLELPAQVDKIMLY